MSWVFISLSGPNGWLGGAYTEATNEQDALRIVMDFEDYPEECDDALVKLIPDDVIDKHVLKEHRNKILTKEELGDAVGVWI